MRTRRSRRDTLTLFLESGADCWMIHPEEDEIPYHVIVAFQRAIHNSPLFSKLVEVFTRRGKIYLARLDR